MTALAERIAAAHYETHRRDGTPPWSAAPGRRLMIEDAQRYLDAIIASGYDIVKRPFAPKTDT